MKRRDTLLPYCRHFLPGQIGDLGDKLRLDPMDTRDKRRAKARTVTRLGLAKPVELRFFEKVSAYDK